MNARGRRNVMSLIDHETQPLEQWREGVMTQMRVSALLRSAQLCIFEQFCDPGLGAPIHLHAVEEVLEVMEGEAEITLRGESLTLRANQSVVIPAGWNWKPTKCGLPTRARCRPMAS